MAKKYLLAVLGAAAALTLTACKADSTDSETAKQTASSPADDEAAGGAEGSEETDTQKEEASSGDDSREEETASVTPSDYLIKNISSYISPGDLDGLKVTQVNYEITDQTVQDAIDSDLSSYSEEEETDEPAQEGDVVYMNLTSTADGEEAVSEETFFCIGDADYGEDFDQNLIGAKAGDTLEFDVAYGADAPVEGWEDKTVHFQADVTSVCRITVPQYDDEFVSEYLGYSSTEEYEAALRESLAQEYKELSYMDVLSDLISAAQNECVISQIPDDLYEECRRELLSDYSGLTGASDTDEMLEDLGMTEDELDAEVQSLAGRRLLISYICETDNLEVSEADYNTYLEENAAYYEYDSAYDFEEDLGRTYLIWSLYESRAAEQLYQNADITQTTENA